MKDLLEMPQCVVVTVSSEKWHSKKLEDLQVYIVLKMINKSSFYLSCYRKFEKYRKPLRKNKNSHCTLQCSHCSPFRSNLPVHPPPITLHIFFTIKTILHMLCYNFS